MRALDEAISFKADIAEFDIQLTADNIPVASHDSIIRVDSGEQVNIREYAISKLRGLTMGGEPIPTLEELIEASRDKIALFIEVKNLADTKSIIDNILRLRYLNQIAIISFYEDAVLEAKTKRLEAGLIYFKPPGKIIDCSRLKCDIVLPSS